MAEIRWFRIVIAAAIGLAILAADLPYNQRIKAALQRLETVKIIS
jgi:hypothetical protein